MAETKKEVIKTNPEHITELTEVFQEVRTEGYMHDYSGDYKVIGTALKSALRTSLKKTGEEYDYEEIKNLMEYFKRYGMKEVAKMQGFLTWAFMNPKTAMQPYNTIDLQKGNKRGGVANGQRKTIKPNDRDYYNNLFE